MSDFLFSNKVHSRKSLSALIKSIYHHDAPKVDYFHGKWGSLAISRNLYRGFMPYETKEHICFVIGGPVLMFTENDFLAKKDSTEGTQAIYERWIKETKIKWDDDLSGPFVAGLVNKRSSELQIVTDLMSFIPIFKYIENKQLILGTHVDMVAKLSTVADNLDKVSLSDFITSGRITFPYTLYKNVMQVAPATTLRTDISSISYRTDQYWKPVEAHIYHTIDDAAKELRKVTFEYMSKVSSNVDSIGMFLSGGEDSRVVASILAPLKPQAYIFLDSFNREGRIAKKVADKLGIDLTIGIRTPTRYLDILEEATDLVGSGIEYVHAHTLGLHKEYNLSKFDAIFGGYFSDTLLKGLYINKLFPKSFPFLPELKNHKDIPMPEEILATNLTKQGLKYRKDKHASNIKAFRPNTSAEWAQYYPAAMRETMSNFYSNRRLFRTYEPFLSSAVVKLAATTPQSWKLNRRLFRKAYKPYLASTSLVFHGDGRLPYLPWYFNIFFQIGPWLIKVIKKITNTKSINEGPWCDWKALSESTVFRSKQMEYVKGLNKIREVFGYGINENFNVGLSKISCKINLLQISYFFDHENSSK